MSLAGRVELVWLAFPIAEVFSFTLSVIFTLRITKTVINHIGEKTVEMPEAGAETLG